MRARARTTTPNANTHTRAIKTVPERGTRARTSHVRRVRHDRPGLYSVSRKCVRMSTAHGAALLGYKLSYVPYDCNDDDGRSVFSCARECAQQRAVVECARFWPQGSKCSAVLARSARVRSAITAG